MSNAVKALQAVRVAALAALLGMPAQAAANPPMNADCSPAGRIGASDRSSTWPVSCRAMPLAKNRVRSVAGPFAQGPVSPYGEIVTTTADALIRRSSVKS